MLWDAAHDYSKLPALDSGQGGVNGVAFSPDGSTLAAAGYDGKVVLWDIFWDGASGEEHPESESEGVRSRPRQPHQGRMGDALPGLPYSTTCPD